MSDPVTIMGELNDLADSLDTASRVLYKLEEEFAPVAEQRDDLTTDLLVALLSEYEDEGKRLPGEDVRNAIVAKRLREQEPELFGKYRRLRAELDRGEKRAKRIEKELNAKQSMLSYLKTEAQAVG